MASILTKQRPWTKDELNYLRRKFQSFTYDQLSAKFNRSASSIANKAYRLKLSKGNRNFTHGMNKTRFYEIWHGLKQRCNGTLGVIHTKLYKNRGITYDPRWESFENFKADMYPSYILTGGDKAKVTIDRINTNGNYTPENCRWVSSKENANNKRNNVVVGGKTISQWCDELGLSSTEKARIYKRHSKYGATSFEELFTKKLLMSVRAEKKGKQPCIICGTTRGTLRHGRNFPHRVQGMCNTCYMREFNRKKRLGLM